jgi:Protein of unknown function (DUF3352)
VRASRTIAAVAACVAIPAGMMAGCGGDGGGSSNVDVGPAAAVPQNAALYLDATVKPTGAAQTNANAALSKILNTPDPGGKVVSLLEKQSKAGGHPINFQQDVSPWLGEKAGVFFTSFRGNTQQGAVVVEASNPGAALAFAQKASGDTATDPAPTNYNGSSYQVDKSSPDTVFGTVGNFLVEGSVAGFKAAVDASKGDSLGDSSDFKDALDGLPSDRLGTLYTIPKNLFDAIGTGQIGQSNQQLLEKTAGDSIDKPVAGALTASANNVTLEATGGNSAETPQSSLLANVPSQAWLALGIANLGDVAKNALDQLKDQIPDFDTIEQQIQTSTGSSLDQLTKAFGDAALYVEGTKKSTLTGALVVESKDTQLTGRLLGQLQSLLQFGGTSGFRPLRLSGGGTGFQITDPSLATAPVEIAHQADKIVIGYGAGSAARALTPAQNLQSNPTFSAAQGQVSDLGTDFFLDLPSVFRLAEATGSKKDPGFQQAKPYLNSLRYLVTGSGSKDDQGEFKAVVGLK